MKKIIVLSVFTLFTMCLATLPSHAAKNREFEIVCGLAPNGLTRNALQPRLVVQKSVDIKKGKEIDGVQCHYTISSVSFDDAGTPTADDQVIPDGGIALVAESLRPEEYLTIPPYGKWYINILAEADGYADCLVQVLVRNWQFGKNYDTQDGTMFQNEKSTRDFPKQYYGLTFSHFAYTRQALVNRISVTPGNLVSVKVSTEGYAGLYLKGDSPKGSEVTFHLNGADTETLPIMATASACKALVASTQKVKPGDKLSFRAAENTVQVYNIAVFEQKKINP